MEEPEQTDADVKTTVLTNIPIVVEEVFTEHIMPDDLAVFSNSDGNLTINTVEQVVEIAVPGEAQEHHAVEEEQQEEESKGAVYITQIGEPAEEMEDGEFEEYELYPEDEEEEEDDDGQDQEDDSSMVDDPNFEVDERDTEEEEQEQFECATCKRNFKTPAVSILIKTNCLRMYFYKNTMNRFA